MEFLIPQTLKKLRAEPFSESFDSDPVETSCSSEKSYALGADSFLFLEKIDEILEVVLVEGKEINSKSLVVV